MRKAKIQAIGQLVSQKAAELAADADFKSAVESVLPELEITETMIQKAVLRKLRSNS